MNTLLFTNIWTSGTDEDTTMITPGRGGASPDIADSTHKLDPTSDSNPHDVNEAQVELTHIPVDYQHQASDINMDDTLNLRMHMNQVSLLRYQWQYY